MKSQETDVQKWDNLNGTFENIFISSLPFP